MVPPRAVVTLVVLASWSAAAGMVATSSTAIVAMIDFIVCSSLRSNVSSLTLTRAPPKSASGFVGNRR
jgi:hypothetical protein